MKHLLIRFAVCAPLFAAALPVHAQTASGCRLVADAQSGRQILRCGDTVTITGEAGARFEPVDRDGDGLPDAVNLRSKAILVDFTPAAGSSGFEVITPQAIAAVRGTEWAVDAEGDKTAVFVLEGTVEVSRAASGTDAVNLSAGDGVDVDESSAPLEVRRWGAARAAALLARLGR